MEKTALLPQQNAHKDTQTRSKKLTTSQRVLLLFVILLHSYGLYRTLQSTIWAPSGASHSQNNSTDFDWFQIPSQSYLQYHPCFHSEDAKFECARLSVPLDHFNHTTDARISLAVIRLPAAVPPTHPQYGGAILFNPGGPGGSGVEFLLRYWQSADEAIHRGQDSNDTKFYDFISFDPRGVAYSSPMISCFDSDILSWTWSLRIWEEGILGSSDAAFGRLWGMSKAFGGSCSLSADRHDEDIKKFVSTASVAADMIEIIERHGQWRESEAKRLTKGHTISETLRHKPGEEKINYWGFSYGTYLGMTFASMYPDRISRLIVDGVVDAEDYVKALWFDNLADTEKEMKSFYDYCASAGYPSCALANKTEKSTGAEVEARVTRIINSLIHNPLPVLGENPEVITYSDAKHLIFAGLYSPMKSFPLIANILVDIESGNGTQMAGRLRDTHEPSCPTRSEKDPKLVPRRPPKVSLSKEAFTGIACSDGDSQSNSTREDIQEHWKHLTELSPTIGPMWAMFRLQCTHYTVRPLYRFTGPWTGNTSFPMLFIGNSADPVTAVRHARKMSKGYKDSRVLEQESSGHCSSSAPSKCTREVVYRYIQHGELPEHGAHCKADRYPFEADETELAHSLDELFGKHHISGIAGALMPLI